MNNDFQIVIFLTERNKSDNNSTKNNGEITENAISNADTISSLLFYC